MISPAMISIISQVPYLNPPALFEVIDAFRAQGMQVAMSAIMQAKDHTSVDRVIVPLENPSS